jgi:salicylate hydroxylase
MRAVIVGAGIGGLTAAIALVRRGVPVVVLERANAFTPVGAGIQLGPNATRILCSLGLEPALSRVVSEAAGKEVRLWNTGEIWPLFDLGDDCKARFGAPYWLVHRGDLQAVLVEELLRLSPESLRMGTMVTQVSQTDSSATVHDQNTVSGDIVIGCDGVHSAMRDSLFQTPKAKFTGLMAWRGIAEMADLPQELHKAIGTNWVGPGAHVITYPLRGGELFNFVGVVQNDAWTSESWSEVGTQAECAADFIGWNPLVQATIESIKTPYRWALVEREPLDTWVTGRVALLGDACHSTLPFLAQGAGMAIEDAVVLADCLLGISDSRVALKQYAAIRKPRTDAVVAGSSSNTSRFHNPELGHPETARMYISNNWAPELVRKRYDWLFEYDATIEFSSWIAKKNKLLVKK